MDTEDDVFGYLFVSHLWADQIGCMNGDILKIVRRDEYPSNHAPQIFRRENMQEDLYADVLEKVAVKNYAMDIREEERFRSQMENTPFDRDWETLRRMI